MKGTAVRSRSGAARLAALGGMVASVAIPAMIGGAILRSCGPWTTLWAEDWRYPCNNTDGWSPNQPLYIHWYDSIVGRDNSWVDLDAPGFREHIRLMGPDEVEVPLLWSVRDQQLIVFCPQGGLEPHTAYHWVMDDIPSSPQHLPTPEHADRGLYHFQTGPSDTLPIIDTQADCNAHDVPEDLQFAATNNCDPCRSDYASCDARDTADTGEPRDTADTGEPRDTDDTDDTDDTGDTGDTDDTATTPLDTGDGGIEP